MTPLFESSVIPYGSGALLTWVKAMWKFESSIISYSNEKESAVCGQYFRLRIAWFYMRMNHIPFSAPSAADRKRM